MPRAKKPVKRQGANQVKKQGKTTMAENTASTMTIPPPAATAGFEDGPPPDIESVDGAVDPAPVPEIQAPTVEPPKDKVKPAVASTPPPAAPAVSDAPAAPKMTVISSDPVIAMLQRKASVSAQELTSLSGGKPGNRDILVGGKVYFRDGRGYERERPRTLLDANDHLMYAFVTPDSLKSDIVFMNGWFPVTSTNEGGKGCPEHYFNQDGFISRGETYMVWTTREYFNKAVRDRERKLQDSQVGGLTSSKIEGKSNGINQQISVSNEE